MSFWFLANGNRSIEDAWKELGDFSDIKNVATYIARIGLYFSTSKDTKISFTYVDEKKFALNEKFSATKIPDIKTADDKYCFTDGIGTMSLGIAGLIALNLDIPLYTREDIPSAYQVRIAGCKGMLAIHPDSKLDEYYIKVRDSMQKFKSNDWSLEICEHSKPMELKFNNQVIMLLSDLGNSYDVFESYQNAAITNLPRQSEHEQWRKLKYSSAKEDLLKNKIPLPLNEGRNMFGVVDETGILEYGQVFIQYKDLDSTNENRYIVLTGEVLVAKMPCLHPGDFRRLTAVNVPKLQTCIRDCIVFPQKGSRPHPNEMSGSDLDGDQYWVYWGRRLKIRQMDDPLSYEAASPKKVPTITQDIIVDHIIDSLGAESQGIICDTHLAIADFHREHTRFKECIYLAELFARAVDAPKSGETINLDRVYELRDEYCERYPLFMKKYDRPVRNSDSTLNKLFTKARNNFFSQRDSGISLQSSSSVMLKPLKQQQQQQHQSKVDSTDREFQQWLVSHSTRISDDKNSSTTPKPQTTTELTQNSESTSAASGKTKKKTELVEVSSSKGPSVSVDFQSAELLPTASDKPIKKPRVKKEPEEGRRNSIDSQTSEICLDQAAGSAPAQKTKLASSTKTNQASKVDPSTLGGVSLNFQSTEDKTATTKTKKPKETSDAFGTPIKLINSAASSTNSEVSSNLSSLSDKPTNRNLIFNGMKTTTNRLKWNSSKNDYFIVDLDNKDSHENNSTEKVVSSILGFGKTSSFPPDSQLTLVISWGQLFLKISPAVGDTKPKNIKELNVLINEMDRVEYIFEECDVKEITKERDPSEKSRTEYVLVCNCRDISSNDISLIFDEKKKLKRFVYDSTSWICAVRRGEPYQDSFYKINHTTMEIDSKNELFSSYINSIFKNSNEIELLTGISPKLTIVYKLLKPTVQIISLKRMVRFAFEQLEQRKLLSHQFNTLKNLEYSFYQVTDIPTEKVDGKIQERKTLEFHATQFQIAKKHEQDLEQLVKLAETFFD
ncbi:hypothetical protein I4U23_015669 [Adineta vaga]|nr:hypothetical protein I4U23_015669 [Adineta vaga]